VTAFELSVLPGLPAYGEPARPFSAAGTGMQSEGLVVGVKPRAAPSWVGNFVRGLTNYDLVIAHPNAHDALIVAGGQGYVIDPLTAKLLSTFGGAIVEAFPHPTQRATVVNHQNVRFEAIGAHGQLWLTRRISWDGMRSLQRRGSVLTGEAWKPGDTWHAFELNLETGDVVGGSYEEATPRQIVEIYMPLLAEGTDCWRPVAAKQCEDGGFEILGTMPAGEVWQFAPGKRVRCRLRRFAGGSTALVASELVTDRLTTAHR
jgi:hypothetical protein